MTTAKLLGANTAAILGAQSAGGAIGAAISPSKIILGTTTASILGSERRSYEKAYGDYNTGYDFDWSSIVCYDSFIRKS